MGKKKQKAELEKKREKEFYLKLTFGMIYGSQHISDIIPKKEKANGLLHLPELCYGLGD